MAECGKGTPGYGGKPLVSADDGATFLVVSSTKDMSLSKNHEPFEVTSFDSIDGWKEFIRGLISGEISIEAVYLDDDPGQLDVVSAVEVGDTLIFKYRPINQVGKYEWVSTVLVTSWEENNAVDDAASVSAGFQMCGKPVRQLIATV